MIGYNAQCCKNASVSAPDSEHRLNLAADDRRIERSNHAGVIVSNIENIIRLFLEAAFKIHLAQKSEVRAPSL